MKNCQPCIAVHDHRQLHQFFSWWTHACKSLSHWYNGKSHTLKILYHLNGSPSVESNLPNVIFLSQGFYEFFDKSIMHHVSFRSLNVSLPFPNIIGNMIPVYSKRQGFFRKPVIWQNIIWLAFIFRWKHQTKAGKVCDTGKVKSSITLRPSSSSGSTGECFPLLHRHPTDCLFHPLFKRSKEFSSPGFCLADSQAALTLSMPIVSPKDGFCLLQVLDQSSPHPSQLHKSLDKKYCLFSFLPKGCIRAREPLITSKSFRFSCVCFILI